MPILRSVYDYDDRHEILWDLLKERDIDIVGISHQKMPTMKNHCEFVDSKPYYSWDFIVADDVGIVGSIYLTKNVNPEIGVFIFKAHQRRGYASWAIIKLIKNYGPTQRAFLANINPRNEASIALFRKLGFVDCQVTLQWRRSDETPI